MEQKEHSEELKKILSTENLSNELHQEEIVAFGSNEVFKKAIGNDEFTSVIILLTNIVVKIMDSLETRQKAKKKAIKKIEEFRDAGIPEKDLSIAVKTIKRELMLTDIKVYESFKDEFDNLINTIEFLNRFRLNEDMFPYPNLNWINKVKKYLATKKK